MEKDLKNREEAIKYLEFTIEVRDKLFAQTKGETRELISYITVLISTLGVIAGFGFTAFQYIKTPPLFFLGLFLIVSSIMYLAFRTKEYLVVWSSVDTEKYINEFTKKANEIKQALIEKNDSKVEELAKELRYRYEDTSPVPELVRAKTINTDLNIVFFLSSPGMVSILLSFILCF